VGRQIDLTLGGLLAVHGGVVGDRLVEPGGASVQLVVVFALLIGGRDGGTVPRRTVEVMGVSDALGELGLGHRLADERGFGQDLLLYRRRFEGLALFDAKRLAHGHEAAVAFGRRGGSPQRGGRRRSWNQGRERAMRAA
jgi:hypothetical protein